jgi:hypothetical protein
VCAFGADAGLNDALGAEVTPIAELGRHQADASQVLGGAPIGISSGAHYTRESGDAAHASRL